MNIYQTLREIRGLNPERDCERIFRLIMASEFPWEYALGMELGQISTFAVPSIAELLASTGEFIERPAKRSDDTSILLREVVENGFTAERGKQAIRRINRLHARYQISNDDYLYVLSTFVVHPARFIDTHGWRYFSTRERIAAYCYFRRIGEHMAIKEIPGSYQEMSELVDTYGAQHFAFSVGGHRVAMSNRSRLAGDLFPRTPSRLALDIVDALVPENLRAHLALPQPTHIGKLLLAGLLWWRKAKRHHLPCCTKSNSILAAARRSYPNGYQIEEVGPVTPATTCPSTPSRSRAKN
jgi:hypothetical protein